ncbi:uncharacterized protein METZ01_LOCUS410872, partial [marine metagenome]
MVVTDGKHHEARVVKKLAFPLKPDSIVSVDPGVSGLQMALFIDFKRRLVCGP